jgi:aminopeptidase N
LVEGGRGTPASFLDLVDHLGNDDSRAVWEQVIRTFARIDHLQIGQPGRASFRTYAREKLQPIFQRVGWEPSAGEPGDRALFRARLVRGLGDFGDEAVVAEAKRRFAAFLKDPASLPASLHDPVAHIVGRTADRATYDNLLALGRKATSTDERVRYYSAAASALDPELAKETLAISLTDELTPSLISTLITWVATQGEHRDLALEFVRTNFAAVTAKQSPQFRNTFVANLMANFTDRTRATELANFAPAHETSGGRIAAARAQEKILADADFAEQQLPAINEWVGRQGVRR